MQTVVCIHINKFSFHACVFLHVCVCVCARNSECIGVCGRVYFKETGTLKLGCIIAYIGWTD